MKALDYLYAQKAEIEKIDIGRLKAGLLQEVVKDLVELNEAIAELEEFMNINTCSTCKCWDSVELSKIKTISYCRFLNVGTKHTFYCNEYEAREL